MGLREMSAQDEALVLVCFVCGVSVFSVCPVPCSRESLQIARESARKSRVESRVAAGVNEVCLAPRIKSKRA